MMESTLLSAMARLRIALRTLEADLGMGDLSPAELDALAATVQLSEENQYFKAADLANHPLLDQISRASKYRVIHSLETRGLLTQVQHNGRKRYVLSAGQA
jgi:DNA-binding MarR family transcriptional regulator